MAPPVPMGGIRTDSIRRSGDPGEVFNGDFWGAFDGLLTREPATANSARVDLLVGDGSSSSSVVSWSAPRQRLLADERRLCACFSGEVACRNGE